MLKIGDVLFLRTTSREFKIEGFLDEYYAFVEPKWAKILSDRGEAVFVNLGDGVLDLYTSVNSNLYMSEQEHKLMTRYVAGVDPYCDDPTVIIFDKQSGRVYKKEDFVPNPR